MGNTATDNLIVYGKIFTSDAAGTIAEAMVAEGGKIVYVGSREGAEAYRGAQTTILEQRDGLIIPGIVEGHAHVTLATEIIFGVNLSGLESVQEYQEAVAAYVKAHPDEAVIAGSGYENGLFEEPGPTAALLDQVCREKPVVLQGVDHHSYWANTRAMELAGITEETPEPENGEIVRFPETGKPTGWFKEMAGNFFKPILPEQTVEHYKRAISYYQELALPLGITVAMEPLYDRRKDFDLRLDAYEELAREGKLKIHFEAAYEIEAEDDGEYNIREAIRYRERFAGYDRLGLHTIKLFMDGVVEGHTAWLREPYEDTRAGGKTAETGKQAALGDVSPDCGEPVTPIPHFRELTGRAIEEGFDVHTHAIGDAAIDAVLDAYELAQKDADREYRNAITHLQICQPDQIERMKKLGVTAVTNPYWHYRAPLYFEELEVPYLGRQRAEREYYLGSFLRAGIVTSQASDFPVTASPNPMESLHIMVNRRQPGVPDMEILGEQEAISVAQALRVLTWGGAWQTRLEDRKGSLEVGKDADFVILSEDVLTLPADTLYNTVVTAVFIGGEQVYAGGGQSPQKAAGKSG